MKEHEPERNESTDEAVWRDLVSRLQNMPADEAPGGPDVPDPRQEQAPGTPEAENGRNDNGRKTLGPADPHGAATDAGSPGPASRSAAERTRAIFENQPFQSGSPQGPRDYEEPEEIESEGEFVPPEPPPFGTGEPLVILAWVGAVGGPILLLLFAMFWRSVPLAIILGVIALFVASAGYLIFRLPSHHDDDGAAV